MGNLEGTIEYREFVKAKMVPSVTWEITREVEKWKFGE